MWLMNMENIKICNIFADEVADAETYTHKQCTQI